MFNMTEPTRLNDVFPEWLTGGGIFSTLQSFPVPWKGENISDALDLEYHGNVSGDKIISPLVEKVKTGGILSEVEKTMIATSILSVYGVNWGKQWETLSFEYSPIENYRMTERMTDDEIVKTYGKSITRTDDLSHTKIGTETDTPNLTSNSANTIHGFNSTNGVPTDKQEQTQTGTEERRYNTTDADTGTQTIVDGGTDTEKRNYSLTRSGNIGVTTSQQMIESERALWIWNFFKNVVFPDIDRVLTIQVY